MFIEQAQGLLFDEGDPAALARVFELQQANHGMKVRTGAGQFHVQLKGCLAGRRGRAGSILEGLPSNLATYEISGDFRVNFERVHGGFGGVAARV